MEGNDDESTTVHKETTSSLLTPRTDHDSAVLEIGEVRHLQDSLLDTVAYCIAAGK
jgi:hypothetical protein